MKTRCLILLSLLMSFIMTFAVEAFAAENLNPTGYISLNKYYPLVPENPDGTLPEYYSFTTDSANYYGYIGQIRAFVPPGTVILDLSIMEAGKQMVVAHHMLPPTGKPDEPPKNYIPDNNYTLAELMAGDCWVTENSYDTLNIASDSFSPPLEISKAGWLYAKVGGGSYSQVYANRFTARVKSDVYNAWWNTYIKSEAGWNLLVEGVETYKDPTQPSSELKVEPSSRTVGKDASTTTFIVTNIGSGTMPWTAVVTQGNDWLFIDSGLSGTNTGTITCRFTAASSTRTGKITVTAIGATSSPFDVTVVQAGKAVAMPIPATGQNKCYDAEGNEISCPTPGQQYYGQDGNFQNNNSMSYTKLDIIGNELADDVKLWAMVRDNVTGLVWEVKTNYDNKMNYWDPHDADNVYTWFSNNSGTPGNGTDTEDFIKKLNSEQFGGFKDWRIPTVKELADISTYNIPLDSPVVNPIYFAHTVPDIYWSSTPFVINPIQTWGVDFNIGLSNYYTHNSRYYVRAVRGDSAVTSNYEANANNVTITDKTAGLMWQKDGAASGDLVWEKALEYCENLNLNVFGGYSTGWRLPSIKELKSLTDYTRKDPAINTDYFTTFSEFYWSSTTLNHEKYADYAWGIDFMDGSPMAYTKDTLCPVRAVRSVPMLTVLPSSQNVTKDAGSVTFNVLITGTQPLPWNAEIVGTSNWLEIVPPKGNNSNTGTITCKYSANNVAESRTATIRITATGAELNSQVDVTVTQDPECAATKINGELFIPYLTYNTTTSQKLSLSADFKQTVNPSYPMLELYKLSNFKELANPPLTCTPSTLSDKFVIHIPDVIISGTHFWMELTYNQFLSTSTDAIFVAYGEPITN